MKLPGKDATCEENLEKREIHRLDDDDLHFRNQSCTTAAFQEKEKKSPYVIETKDPFVFISYLFVSKSFIRT